MKDPECLSRVRQLCDRGFRIPRPAPHHTFGEYILTVQGAAPPRPTSRVVATATSPELLELCTTVMHYDARMQRTRNTNAGSDPEKVTRITVTLPQENYEPVVRMAKNKKVSTSWIVRDAVEKYLAADNADLLWALRRKIAKQLIYDERGTPMQRRKVKREKLKEQKGICALCSERAARARRGPRGR
jgi:hypothetical protein